MLTRGFTLNQFEVSNRSFKSVLVLAVALMFPVASVAAQEETAVKRAAHSQEALSELRDKRRAFLVVLRPGIVDADDNERTLINFVLRADPEPRGRFLWVYSTLAKKLNSYIRKYKSLASARGLADADYVIFFNLLEYRRILDTTYPFGELFVIVKGEPLEQKPPRIIWRSKVLYSGDAITKLIRELKLMRGED